MKSKIICIVGPSGSGKTTMAHCIEEKLGIKTVVSYTTRPIREGELEGREHHFITKEQMPNHNEMLAYTVFGNNSYYALLKDIPQNDTVTYVVDEKGVMMMEEEYSHQFDIKTILIKRDNDLIKRNATASRIKRDKHRIHIDEESYDAIIENNGTLEEFLDKAVEIIQGLL